VIRGRIGVSVAPVPREGFEDFGLKSRAGALVSSVASGSAAEKGGLRPGDVILEYNGRAVATTSELVKMVTGTKPGSSVPVRIVRDRSEQTLTVVVDELDLEAEQGRQARGGAPATPEQQGTDSFGLTLGNLTPQQARQLQLPSGRSGAVVTDVVPNGPAGGVLRQGDVILSINRQPVSNATEAGRLFQQVQSGRLAQILVWRDGGEVFVTVRKD
jgi:serine protease Do